MVMVVDRILAATLMAILLAIMTQVYRNQEARSERKTTLVEEKLNGARAGASLRRCGRAHDDDATGFMKRMKATPGGRGRGRGGGRGGAGVDANTFGVRSNKVVFARAEDGSFVVKPATVVVSDGRIVKVVVLDSEVLDECDEVLDFGSLVVMPGFIDVHVHVNEPGLGDNKEGWMTATKAAAAGGVTTLVDMPLNGNMSTIDVAMMQAKLATAEGKTYVDVAYWGGFVTDNTESVHKVDTILKPLLKSGVAGVKAFLNKANEAFNFIGREHIEAGVAAMVEAGLPLIVHAELDLPTEEIPGIVYTGDPTKFKTFAALKPRETEQRAIKLLLDVWKEKAASSRLHIAHLADAESLPMIIDAKRRGMNVTVETCPQYLYFTEDEIPDRSTLHKCAPPIRTAKDRDGLWNGILAGTIDIIASDHAPYAPEEKSVATGNFMDAFAGISSLQLDLPVTWTAGASHGLTLETMAEVWARRPAKLAGLSSRKGSIEVGMDADFLVFDPDAEFIVGDDSVPLFHRHPSVTPFMGERLRGRVKATFVRGEIVFLDGHGHSDERCGKSLLKYRDF